MRQIKWRYVWLVLILMWIIYVPINSAAQQLENVLDHQIETEIDEIKLLLQKGLDIHELDRELNRLTLREQQLLQEMTKISDQLHETSDVVEQKKVHAGKIIRAYYTGEREALYLQVFKMDDLVDALVALDFLQMIFQYDQQLLDSYKRSIDTLSEQQNLLEQKHKELSDLKQELLHQRQHLVQLEEELEQELDAIPAGGQVREDIHAMTELWEKEGLPLFRQYFSALASAMQQLPELIAEDNEHLVIQDSKMIFQLTDEQLNAFLRNKNEIFEWLTFQFEQDSLIVLGEQNDLRFHLNGRYAIEQEPEHRIRFIVESIRFNDLELPETTIAALEEEFDLSLYPEKFQIKVEATNIQIADHTLKIELKAAENWLDSILDGWFSSALPTPVPPALSISGGSPMQMYAPVAKSLVSEIT